MLGSEYEIHFGSIESRASYLRAVGYKDGWNLQETGNEISASVNGRSATFGYSFHDPTNTLLLTVKKYSEGGLAPILETLRRMAEHHQATFGEEWPL